MSDDRRIDPFNRKNIDKPEEKKSELKGKSQIEKKLFSVLDDMEKNGATDNKEEEVTNLHREWLTLSWPNYTEDKHLEIIEMYEADARYREYFGEARSKMLITAVKRVLT
nr:TipAS antibiotic-recognition domain-containing protein [Mammaliicoccus sp. Marseille-Q6498]